MVTKGIITESIGKSQVRVRIPIYDKAGTAVDATPDSELSIAAICTLPGNYPNYSIGDVVVVAFEQDIFTQPVIIGLLYTDTPSSVFTDLNVGTINISEAARLPQDTSIGDTTAADLSNISNTRGNLQNQIDDLLAKCSESYVTVFTPDEETHNLTISVQRLTPDSEGDH